MVSLMFPKTTSEIGSGSHIKAAGTEALDDIEVSRHVKLW
jgi:hypothetical protein